MGPAANQRCATMGSVPIVEGVHMERVSQGIKAEKGFIPSPINDEVLNIILLGLNSREG
jgi:hypothetical protein